MSRAYYNEFSPHAAQWIRNLIEMGMIAPGDVDERDIRDVKPSDLVGYTQCHFFAGIGVWSYALRMAGWSDDRPVWTASPPCQPFSAAGRGGGVADERHLWPHLHHLIRVCRPPVFFGEQVASKDGLGWLDLVQADMEAEDYSGGAFDLCAAGVGAPHIRQRLSLVFRDGRIAWAPYAARCGWREEYPDCGGRRPGDCTQGWAAGHSSSSSSPIEQLDYAEREGLEGHRGHVDRSQGRSLETRSDPETGANGALDDLLGLGRDAGRHPDGKDDGQFARAAEQIQCGELADPDGRDGCAERQQPGGQHGQQQADGGLVGRAGGPERGGEIQPHRMADDDDERRQRGRTGEASDGRDPARVESERLCDADGEPQRPGPVNSGWANADWLFCRDGKWRPVESGTFPLVDGSAFRVDSGGPFAGKSRGKMLEGAGNAIVSEQQAHVIAAYLEHEADEIAAFHAAGSREPLTLGDLL